MVCKRPKHTETKRDSCKPLVNCGKTWKKIVWRGKAWRHGGWGMFLEETICCLKTFWTLSGHQISSDIEAMRRRCERAASAEVHEAFWNRLCASSGALPVATACVISQGRAGEMHGPMVHQWSFIHLPKYAKVLRSVGGWCRPANQWGVLFLDKFWDARLQHSLETKSQELCHALLTFWFSLIQGHSIWCLDMLSGFRLVPGSSWIWTNSQGAGWALFHVSSFLGDGLYNLSKVPCSELAKLCRALCRALGESGESGERYKQTYNLKTGRRPFLWVKIWHAPWQHDATGKGTQGYTASTELFGFQWSHPKWLHMRRCKEWHQLQNGWTCFL